MSAPFPFEMMTLFGFLSMMLLGGLFLRATIGILQHFLFPACLIGGFIGLLLISTNAISFSANLVEAFAFHCFNLSFISVGLTPNENRTSAADKKAGPFPHFSKR